MKNVKFILLISLATTLIFACSKDDVDEAAIDLQNSNGEQYMRADFDGQFSELIAFGSEDSGAIFLGGFFSSQNDYPQIIFYFQDTVQADTYDLSGASQATFYYNQSVDSSLFVTEGQIIIELMDTVNNKVKGKFEGKLKGFNNNSTDSIIVENGEFKLKYS